MIENTWLDLNEKFLSTRSHITLGTNFISCEPEKILIPYKIMQFEAIWGQIYKHVHQI